MLSAIEQKPYIVNYPQTLLQLLSLLPHVINSFTEDTFIEHLTCQVDAGIYSNEQKRKKIQFGQSWHSSPGSQILKYNQYRTELEAPKCHSVSGMGRPERRRWIQTGPTEKLRHNLRTTVGRNPAPQTSWKGASHQKSRHRDLWWGLP